MRGRGPTLLFGGTFDPPHRGHVEPCRAAADAIGAARIIVIPASISPTKTARPTDDIHRLAMLELAFADEPRSVVSTIELDRAGPSYFVDTLRAMRAELGPDVDLRFLIGVDQALHFDRWREPDAILALATPVVLIRPPWSRTTFVHALSEVYGADDAERWGQWVLDAPLIDLSATQVRAMLRAGEDVGTALPARVIAYIREHGLYASPGASSPAQTEQP